jgi:hypothetical protein
MLHSAIVVLNHDAYDGILNFAVVQVGADSKMPYEYSSLL